MFDLLQHRPRSPERLTLGAGVSLAVHAALALSLAGGAGKTLLEPPREATQSVIESALRYLLPPNRPPESSGEAEAKWSPALGNAPTLAAPNVYTENRLRPGTAAPDKPDSTVPEPLQEAAAAQNAFSFLDVDTAAVRDPTSAVPVYPPLLEKQGIEGVAVVRFVVDTNGRADVSTFRVVETNHSLFAAAVRAALPGMKFHPATVGAQKVRQLVELPFRFGIIRRQASDGARKP